MKHQPSFFTWQNHVLGWLLAWGIGSVVVGAGLATDRRAHIRQIGLQAIGWGAIDAALALNGRRGARSKQRQSRAEQPDVAREAAWFQQIVALNAGLDVLYIAGDLRLLQTARRGSSRQGMGIGIIIQGCFLLLYDSFLTVAINRWRGSDETM